MSLAGEVFFLIVLGVVHLFWLASVGMVLYGIFIPEGMLTSFLFALLTVPVLSLPLGYYIATLQPKRPILYCLSALAPAIAFYGLMLLHPETPSSEKVAVLLGVIPVFVGLPVAVFVANFVRRKIGA